MDWIHESSNDITNNNKYSKDVNSSSSYTNECALTTPTDTDNPMLSKSALATS